MSTTEYRHPRSPERGFHCPGTDLECLLVPNQSFSLEVLASDFRAVLTRIQQRNDALSKEVPNICGWRVGVNLK